MGDAEGDAPLAWGGPRELTPFETLMWRADVVLVGRASVAPMLIECYSAVAQPRALPVIP